MSYYFVEAEDKPIVNFKVYDTCTEAQKRSLELAELLDIPVCVFKSFSYPQNRDDAIYDINEPLDVLFKALKRIVIDQKQEIENNKN